MNNQTAASNDVVNDSANQTSIQVLFDTRQAAEYLSVSTRFLEIARMKGGGPQYVRCSPKMIRYRLQDLNTWVNDKLRQTTSEAD